ncbi:hypothetical protein FPV67DRAFT_889415 [Lyophyllum atratum]|nr:hypothetical protein FPV67DRAFT_889415 [Lyophyllum atratum]
MLYKNSLPLEIDDQHHLTSIGCPVFNAKISMSKRNSWPPQITDTLNLTCEQPASNMHVADLDPCDMENVHVFLYSSSLDAMTKISPCQRSLGLKDGRQIPNRSSRSRLPSIRMPPSDLWTMTPSKTSQALSTSTSPPEILPPNWAKLSHLPPRPTSEREPLRTMSQAPIGSERHRWTSTPGAGSSSTPVSAIIPRPPGPCATPVKKSPEPAPTAFVDVLCENRRRNPHAPSMVSLFNPLREMVPFRAWACMPSSSRQARGAHGTLTLPSARYRTSLYTIPVRARKDCEWASNGLSRGKEYWLNKTRSHCRDCRQETLRIKLLAFSYLHRQSVFLYGPPILMVPSNDDEMEVDDPKAEPYDDDLLDSPTLRDFDDFDDFDDESSDDDAVLNDHRDVDMWNRSLF